MEDKGSNFIFVLCQFCGSDTPYLAPHELEKKHAEAREASLTMFDETRKMGGSEFSKEYLDRLEKEISEAFENFMERNDGKNIFNPIRKPAVFFAVVGLSSFAACVFAPVRYRSWSCASGAMASAFLFSSLIGRRRLRSNSNPEEDVE